MLKLFGNPQGAPELDWFNIPLKNGKWRPRPPLFCHISFFFPRCIKKTAVLFFSGPCEGQRRPPSDFWEHIAHTEFFKKHPYLRGATDLDHTLPLGFHGDAGAFTKHDSLMVLSWNGVLGQGQATSRTRRLIFTFVRKQDYGPHTLDHILKIFSWSLNHMARGKNPTLDFNEKSQWPGAIESSLAGPYRGILAQIRGDWQFYVETFAFPPWNGAIADVLALQSLIRSARAGLHGLFGGSWVAQHALDRRKLASVHAVFWVCYTRPSPFSSWVAPGVRMCGRVALY